MVRCALSLKGPAAIRYGRGALPTGEPCRIKVGKWNVLRPRRAVTLVATGRMVERAEQAAEMLSRQGVDCGLYSALCLSPMDEAALTALGQCTLVVTAEDGVLAGGMGEHIARRLSGQGVRVRCLGLPEEPLPAGSIEELLELSGLDGPAMARRIMEWI